MTDRKGTLFVLTGPSGVGKGTVLSAFFDKYGKDGFFFSVSATTRAPREGEQEGVNYYYKTHEEFQRMVDNNEFLEHATFCENRYGTPAAPVDKELENGKNVILEIEVEGGLNVMKIRPDATFIFVAPPSYEELERRIRGRNTETEEVIAQRLQKARWELSKMGEYDYIVVNREVDRACDELKTLVDAEGLRASNNQKFIKEVQR